MVWENDKWLRNKVTEVRQHKGKSPSRNGLKADYFYSSACS